ncbi:hypothetical protein BS618_32975 [Rhodococcus erythropolis]|nr:hypothetical protein BS618_32975 [Rhodococcus erythropolis]
MSTRYSSSSSSSSSGGIGFVGLLTIVFITLKLLNVINWSWWWVVSPIWITASLVIITVVLGCIGYLIYRALRRNK